MPLSEIERVGFDGSPDYLVRRFPSSQPMRHMALTAIACRQVMPDAALERMRAQLGANVKLFALLRNPTFRFYSAYASPPRSRTRVPSCW